MTATMNTIEKANQKANIEGAEYSLSFLAEYQWVVTRKSDATRQYSVITLDGFESCQCKAFEHDGYCKHLALCQESEEMDARAEEAEYAAADRYAKY